MKEDCIQVKHANTATAYSFSAILWSRQSCFKNLKEKNQGIS